ncbi:PDDEXK nuclease domain-containing protein [Frigoriflavimonas asaccharolytica]|uniref:Putative nuclease of restriction endonuclease-like (RecB) superfamily n=1 Tax=Frigoriflavimonas asaccharolytica TaxID=2735899 RepID=A0A8J8G9S8_9FLAO|nr:PDDEXK nuclease domain-containing protein [Frigoriflavimonas asaccharolytica]NRS92174.1 putative nuclease of restriction endonuclease-like (RecB) superfamily [Frigoriflavimonas asaccharolytica]
MLEKIDSRYKNWIVDLKQKIQQSQIKAAIKVNSALIELYWDLGKEIASREFENSYGSGFFKQLSADLRAEFPQIKGFSERNLKYCKTFYLFYNQEVIIRQQVVADFKYDQSENRQQLVADFENENFSQKLFIIPWGHHVTLITKCKTSKEAYFYINKTIENGWSRVVLLNMLSANLIESQGKAITNFSKTLPDHDSELVKQTLKDPYFFDFLNLSEIYKENELESALVDNISKFLIELGSGFAFVGKQVEITVSDKSFFIDLLFYHIKLKRYVVIELKAGNFQPEFAGKLNFYVTAVDKQMRDEADNATIGLLICKEKDEIIAEYSLTDLHKPLGISSYEFQKILPENFKSHLPSIEMVEEELKKLENKSNLRDS